MSCDMTLECWSLTNTPRSIFWFARTSCQSMGEVWTALLQLKILKHLFDVGEVSILQEMGFPCNREASFIKILPGRSSPRLVPVPGIVSAIISLVIASSFKDSTQALMSGLEGEEVSWIRLGEVLSGSLSLTIRLWFPRPILSRRVWSKWGMV